MALVAAALLLKGHMSNIFPLLQNDLSRVSIEQHVHILKLFYVDWLFVRSTIRVTFKKIVFTDEAHCTTKSYNNKQNWQIWDEVSLYLYGYKLSNTQLLLFISRLTKPLMENCLHFIIPIITTLNLKTCTYLTLDLDSKDHTFRILR